MRDWAFSFRFSHPTLFKHNGNKKGNKVNNTETKQIQYSQALEQEQLVGYWIKRHGISKKDLDTHPQIDDVMFLIKFRAEFWDMNNQFKKLFDNAWNWVYNNKLPLKNNHLNNLKKIGTSIVKWRTKRQTNQTALKAFRNKHKIGTE